MALIKLPSGKRRQVRGVRESRLLGESIRYYKKFFFCLFIKRKEVRNREGETGSSDHSPSLLKSLSGVLSNAYFQMFLHLESILKLLLGLFVVFGFFVRSYYVDYMK